MGSEIVIVPTVFLVLGWVTYVIVDGFRRRQQLRVATEFHAKLLGRIGSAREFGEFLNTEGGARFLNALTIEREGGPHLRILRAVQTGIVSLALGLGLFILINFTALNFGARDRFEQNGEQGLAVLATIATAIGVGLLLSALASFGISKRLGLFDGESARRRLDSAHTA